jgi:magnesium-protoporphyrin O-methyltransferase
MVCDQCRDIEQIFNEKDARKQLRKYLKKGASKSTRLLVSALEQEGVEGDNLLDIGGGIGAIQQELFKAGVTRAWNVDAASGYVQVSREEAKRGGFTDRVGYTHGNFVELASQVEEADIVALDRVICCFPDMKSLVALSAEKARKLYGLVFPKDTWWLKLGVFILNPLFRIFSRTSFESFVHPTDEVDSLLRSKGLQQRYYRTSGMWQIMVYARV